MMKRAARNKIILIMVLCLTTLLALTQGQGIKPASAQLVCGCAECAPKIKQCDLAAVDTSKRNTGSPGGSHSTIPFMDEEFVIHREWIIKEFFERHILPALMLFAEQITAMAMQQVVTIGTFLDAKHQLETQRLFQELTAKAHKDYQPSEGMCVFGTNMRSLAASERNTDLSAITISRRMTQRELLSGDASTTNGTTSDFLSRLKQFREIYCSPDDNNKGMTLLCKSPMDVTRVNKDIDYTAAFDAPLTLKLDFTTEGNPDHASNKHDTNLSPDEEDLFALSSNLYANEVAPSIPPTFLSNENAEASKLIPYYMKIRALAAKRSVASNSFATIAGLKTQGEKQVQPYLYALMKEMGITDEEEIKKYLGERPSYYAQMEVLTKKLYQNPMFYTELYDKPANVERKNVSMQAIELMQKRDIYRSMLRSEAILSVMLETALGDQEEKIVNELNRVGADDVPVKLPE